MLKELCIGNILRDANGATLQENQGGSLKVFISWSGEKSHGIARQLAKWLPYIIQAIKPFVSSGDIRKGARWSDVLAEELKETQYGIICITRQNIMSPWINFEAGALSKVIGHSYVSPLLFGVEPSRLQGPLSQFQATVFDEQGNDIFGLVSSINNSLPIQQQVSPEVLRETFKKWWPALKKDIESIANKITKETETNYPWLYTLEDLIRTENNKTWESIWVINPKPYKHWSNLKSIVRRNMEQGVTYEFIVSSDIVDEFRQFVISEFTPVANEVKNHLDPEKLFVGCIKEEEFKSLAVTHYRILNSNGNRKVLFEVPIGSCGYWVDTEGEAVDGFYSRFSKMKDKAKCVSLSNSPQLQQS